MALFDDNSLDPIAIQQARTAAGKQEDFQLAQAAPQTQINYSLFQGARGLGQGLGKALGAEMPDPQMEQAQAYQADAKANAGLAATDPVGYLKRLAEAASARGQGDLAATLSSKAAELEAKRLQATRTARAAGTEKFAGLLAEKKLTPEAVQKFMETGDYTHLVGADHKVERLRDPETGQVVIDPDSKMPVLVDVAPNGDRTILRMGSAGTKVSVDNSSKMDVNPNAPVDTFRVAQDLESGIKRDYGGDIKAMEYARQLQDALLRAKQTGNPADWARAQNAWAGLVSAQSTGNIAKGEWERILGQYGIVGDTLNYLSGKLTGVPTADTLNKIQQAAAASVEVIGRGLAGVLDDKEPAASEYKLTPAQKNMVFGPLYRALDGTKWQRGRNTGTAGGGQPAEAYAPQSAAEATFRDQASERAQETAAKTGLSLAQVLENDLKGMQAYVQDTRNPEAKRRQLAAAIPFLQRELAEVQAGRPPTSEGGMAAAKKFPGHGKTLTRDDIEESIRDLAKRTGKNEYGPLRAKVLEDARARGYKIEGE